MTDGTGRTTVDSATPDPTLRTVDLARTREMAYLATNVRGGTLAVGDGSSEDFTPVELLMVALAACGAIDLEHVTRKRADATGLTARVEGHKIRDEQGNRLTGLTVALDVDFPDGPEGDAARAVVPRTLRMIEERLCTVGRTVTVGDHVRYVEGRSAQA
ncbi:OsmC family protein [Nocardioides sp. GY 10127]|uniref:OsmC family protein n=1 Tax=Nocardioides sp. GY 10127 TaxID=2569762 RepID=UPI0010A9497B|nr:OsmC family protein [Nocardioides sp. GY 10127]TIC86445.1 OsmC family peroxiredoxin [Nocardioides sp. GY 10127]